MKKSSFSTTNPNKSRLWHNILTFFVGGFQRERVPFSVLWRIGIFWKILFNGNNLAISFHWVLSSVVVKCCLKVHLILELMSLACHKKSYLICVEFSKYYVIFIYFQAAVSALFWLSQFCKLKKKSKQLLCNISKILNSTHIHTT